MLTIVLNGELQSVPTSTTVADLVSGLRLVPAQVAVEKNRDIVPRAEYARTELHEGDRLEIVTFVGGG